MLTKVISYIDGFNLYYALKRKGWRRYYWLNLQDLGQRLLEPGQILVGTKYFTARVRNNPGKMKRQDVFIDALKTLPDLEVIEGRYQKRERLCAICNQLYWTYEEKMTDVNIAIEILADAVHDNFDTVLLISADGDLTKPLSTVKQLFPHKNTVVAFPPGYSSFSLKDTADNDLTIGRKTLKDSQFPPMVKKADGFILRRPPGWK